MAFECVQSGRMVRSLALAAAIAGLAGCGGGGGSGFEFAPRPEPDPLAPPQPASDFQTVEFFLNYGLDLINADSAYAKGAYGSGVIVAVIDTGIDTTHPDLDANLSPASIDIVDPGFPLQDGSGHGTAVAGVIAAEKNDVGTHGVAFEASILAIRADDPVTGDFLDPDVASAVYYAIEHLAHVINLSLGASAPDAPVLRQALINATIAGVVVVAAAGNDGPMAFEPNYPAANAGDPRFNGLVLAVGAVDQFGNLASFSNHCGASKDFCLVAPGEGIVTTLNGAADGSVTTTGDGTSFSAPHVSGAAALLIQAFPNLTPQEVVQIMLQSATDLGTPGVDTVYGHGLLNLDAAVAPLGVVAVPLAGTALGPTAALKDTSLSFGPAFGDASAGLTTLGRAIVLDDFDRPYLADLTAAVTPASRTFNLRALLAPDEARDTDLSLPNGLVLRIASSDNQDVTSRPYSMGDISDGSVDAISLSGSLSERTALALGYGVPASGPLDHGMAAVGADGLFWLAPELTNPQYSLAGTGGGIRLDRAIGRSTTVSFGWFEGDDTEDPYTGIDAPRGSIGQATFDHGFDGGGLLRLGFALVDEPDAFLGGQGDGAFVVDGATSRFLAVSGGLPIAETIELVGSVTLASSDVATAGLLSDWGTVKSSAFGVGAVARNVLDDGDRIGVLVGQPLRVYEADASLTVPVALTPDETVVQSVERVDVTPSGREIDLQLAYDRLVRPGMNLSSWLMMQTEPGHDAGADNAYGAGLLLRMVF